MHMFEDMKKVAQMGKELQDQDVAVRLAAVHALSLRATPDAAELLLGALADPDRGLRRAAREGLAKMRQDALADRVLGALAGQWGVINGLTDVAVPEQKVLVRTFEYLLPRAGKSRRWLVHALGHLGDRRAIPWIKPYLRRGDPLTQRAACIALGLLGTTEAVPDLLELVESHDVHIVCNALVALERLGEARLVHAYRGMRDGHPEAVIAVQGLIEKGDRRIAPLLLAGLRRPGHSCRSILTGLTLCAMGVAEAVTHVRTLLDEIALAGLEQGADEDAGEVIVTVAGLLASSGLPQAACAAVSLLASPVYWAWHAEIADKLLDTLSPAALPALLELLRDGAQWPDPDEDADNEARVTACRLLAKIGDRKAVEPLLAVLQYAGVTEELHNVAIEALNQIGERAGAAALPLPAPGCEPAPGETTADTRMTTNSQGDQSEGSASRTDVVPEKEYVFPILRALVAAGGTSGPAPLRAAVYPSVADRLTPRDCEPEPDKGGHRSRWEHRMEHVRFKMCLAGFMRRDSPRGVWEITDEGRAHLAADDPAATWRKVGQAFTQHRKSR